MKKITSFILALITIIFCASACSQGIIKAPDKEPPGTDIPDKEPPDIDNKDPDIKNYVVRFIIGDGAQILNGAETEQTVAEGGNAFVPQLYREFCKYEWDTEIPANGIFSDMTFTALWALDECKLPVLKIDMLDGLGEITSKEIYRPCRAQMIYPDNAAYEFDVTAELRGRGNSTWGQPKNPYRLRFAKDKPLSVLGSAYTARSWALMANYFDKTLLRNAIVYDFGRELSGLAFTPAAKPVELYFNNDYRGVYMISDQVGDLASSGTRVPVKNPSQAETVPDFLLELDARLPSDMTEILGETWFRSSRGFPFAIKTDATASQFTYIVNEVNRLEAMILTGTFAQLKEEIDLPSFIDFFLVSELFKNPDIGYSSVYCYKAKGGKLTMGPLWDFDICGGNGLKGSDWAHDIATSGLLAQNAHNWFKRLMSLPQFKAQYVARWKELYGKEIPQMINRISEYGNFMADYFSKDQERWKTFNYELTNSTAASYKTYTGQIYYFQRYITDRAAWLNTHYNTTP